MINLASRYKIRPSELFGIGYDEYLSYCFDEVCFYMELEEKDGKKPVYDTDITSFERLYKHEFDKTKGAE